MQYRIEQSAKPGEGTLFLEGELTIHYAGQLKDALLKAVGSFDAIVISLGNVQDVDLSCLQLICSAHRTSAKLKKKLSLAADPPDLFFQAVRDSGYSRTRGCGSFESDENCLWTGGKH